MKIGDSVEITLGDGLLALAQMDDASVDHVFSDPPYALRTHAGSRTARGTRHGKGFYEHPVDIHNPAQVTVDFDAWETETFLDFCEHAVRVARRWVVLTCDLAHMAAAVYEDRLPVVRVGAWVKPNPAPQFSGDRPGQGWETVLILHREGEKRWNGGGAAATWNTPVVHGDFPTQKPIPLFTSFLGKFTDIGDTVLDPLMGSGTTGVACIRLDRNFIGYEVREEAFVLAEKRIRHEASQLKLFT